MMNSKKWLCVFLALALLLGAAGCAPEASSNTDPNEANTGRVEDPFTQPSEDPDTEAASSTGPETDPGKVEDPFAQPSEDPDRRAETDQPFEQFFGFGLSISGRNAELEEELGLNYVYNEKTTYRNLAYDGGEMCYPIYILTEGYEEEGLGVLLFLNGLPQPYRVEGETEYSYMHTFYLEDGTHYPVLYFVPVTGQAGDDLEMWGQLIFGPERIPTNDNPNVPEYASTSVTTSLTLHFNATPPAPELPETPNRILSQTVSYKDTTYRDTIGWSAQDLQQKISAKCDTPDAPSQNSYERFNISADTPIRLRFEVYGSPLVDYRLVYFLDYVPVAVSMEDLAFIEIESGRKTIVETTVDLSGFDRYSLLFPVLVPLNAKITYDGEAQDIYSTYLLMAKTPFQFILSAAADYQGMLDMNSK